MQDAAHSPLRIGFLDRLTADRSEFRPTRGGNLRIAATAQDRDVVFLDLGKFIFDLGQRDIRPRLIPGDSAKVA